MSFEKRLSHNQRQTDKAVKVFAALEAEFARASADDREVHDEIQAEIDRLVALQEQALNRGLHNAERAKRVRELFL
jgi:hypothetical protein